MMVDYSFSLTGTVVKSLVGRDKKRVFIVIGGTEVNGEARVILVNGSLRPAEKPKQKNLLHVKPIGRLDEDDLSLLEHADNKMIMAMVEKFDTCRD